LIFWTNTTDFRPSEAMISQFVPWQPGGCTQRLNIMAHTRKKNMDSPGKNSYITADRSRRTLSLAKKACRQRLHCREGHH
jgi:hypothetical protein